MFPLARWAGWLPGTSVERVTAAAATAAAAAATTDPVITVRRDGRHRCAVRPATTRARAFARLAGSGSGVSFPSRVSRSRSFIGGQLLVNAGEGSAELGPGPVQPRPHRAHRD